MEYDPARIGYEDLLSVFWRSHDPRRRAWSRQYKSAVFFHDGEQRRLAERARDEAARRLGGEIHTEILPAGVFTPAEDYHQKYYLRSEAVLLRDLEAAWPDPRDLAASTSAARVNGYLGGNGTPEQLRDEIGDLGLSPEGRKRLTEVVGRRRG